jgi:hypothetical protein
MPERRSIFWPFDIRSPRPDFRESARAKIHITDILWMTVLAEEEGAELRVARLLHRLLANRHHR